MQVLTHSDTLMGTGWLVYFGLGLRFGDNVSSRINAYLKNIRLHEVGASLLDELGLEWKPVYPSHHRLSVTKSLLVRLVLLLRA